MNVKAKRNGTQVVTGKVRLSYANLFTPKASNDGGDEKYSVSLLIDKNDKDTVGAIKAAIEDAKERDKGKWNGKIPAGLKVPLRDGDDERPDDDNYAGCYFINCNSKSKPAVVGLTKDAVTGKPTVLGEDEVYSGAYARVSVNFYGYNTNGNKGIGAGLGNVQKLEDGERLGGGSSAEADFDFEDEEDFLG